MMPTPSRSTASEAWLRICRMGGAFALHASLDGVAWQLVRHFALPVGDTHRRGLPVAVAHRARPGGDFRDIRLSPGSLADIRDGS